MIKFSYGDDSHSIDVTEKAKSQFVINDTLRITKDINFNKLFGDPVPLKVKKLTATFDDQTTVVFPEQRQKSYTVELLKSKPKTIVQYWNGSSGESMPAWAVANTEAIKFYHRDFDYKLFDRKSAIQFIRRHFHTNVLVAFCKCAIPAMQSDFFRYCYLLAAGGFYFDLKTQCTRRFLDSFIDGSEEMLLLVRSHQFLFNGFIGARAGANGLAKTIAECVENIMMEKSTELYLMTGTPVLTKQCKLAYGNNYEQAQTINYELDCPIIFSGDKYQGDHWSTAQRKQSIFVHVELSKLLQVQNIFVLNLDSRVDRLNECIAEFAKLGPKQNWERFPARRGANQDVQQQYKAAYAKLSLTLAAHDKRYVDGAFGCLISHYEMVKLAYERGCKRVLILEDDFEATDLLFDCDLLQRIGAIPFDMFYFCTSQMEEPTDTEFEGIKRTKRALTTGAYIIDQSIFQLVLSEALEYGKQIDVFYADIVQKRCNVLCTERCAIVQRESFSDIVQQNIKYRFE